MEHSLKNTGAVLLALSDCERVQLRRMAFLAIHTGAYHSATGAFPKAIFTKLAMKGDPEFK